MPTYILHQIPFQDVTHWRMLIGAYQRITSDAVYYEVLCLYMPTEFYAGFCIPVFCTWCRAWRHTMFLPKYRIGWHACSTYLIYLSASIPRPMPCPVIHPVEVICNLYSSYQDTAPDAMPIAIRSVLTSIPYQMPHPMQFIKCLPVYRTRCRTPQQVIQYLPVDCTRCI